MILNLTQHTVTPEQLAAGVVDLNGDQKAFLTERLTVEQLPTPEEIRARCEDIAEMACHNGLGTDNGNDPFPYRVLIGGAPWMMSTLEASLKSRGIQPLYAFSVRESVEQGQPDGSVKKVNVFRHAGFVPAP